MHFRIAGLLKTGIQAYNQDKMTRSRENLWQFLSLLDVTPFAGAGARALRHKGCDKAL